MKKILIILLLIFHSAIFAQTVPSNSQLAITKNVKQNDATRIIVQDSVTKKLNWILKSSLAVSQPIRDSLLLKENISNKSFSLTASNKLYPNNNAVINGLNLKADFISTYTKNEVDSKLSALNLSQAYHTDFIDSGTHTFTVPSNVIIQNVYLNNIPVYGADWSQSSTTITVSTSITGDKVTITGGTFLLSDSSKKANLTVGKNLFNWQDADVVIDKSFGGGGTTQYTTANALITGFIPVAAGQQLKCNIGSGGYAQNYYDQNKNYLSSVTTDAAFTVPAGAYFLRRVCIYNVIGIQNIQIEINSVSTYFEPYMFAVPASELSRAALKNDVIEKQYNIDSKLNKSLSKNLFNRYSTEIIDGAYMSSNGALNTGVPSYFITHYIPVKAGTTYTATNFGTGGAYNIYYDINKNVISSFNTGTFTTPANTYYVRISGQTANKATQQLELGSSFTSYASYTELSFLDPLNLSILNKLDKSIGKNKFDKNSADIVNGKYLAGGTPPAWSILDNALYYITGYIPVLPNTTYTHSGFGLGGAQHLIFDSNKIFIGSFNTEQKLMPSNGYYVRLSGSISTKDIAQFEIGSTATFYSPYTEKAFLEPITESLADRPKTVILPKKLYFIKGKQNCIYYQNILLQSLNDDGTVFFDKGINRNKLATFNFSAAATSQTLNSLLIDNFKRIESKNITYDVIDPVTNNGKTVNVLHIGDSFTDIGAWLKEVKVLMNAQGVTYNLIGTCGNSTYKAEGLSGGTLANTFLNTSSGVSRIVDVTGVTTMPSTTYPGTSYSDANGNIWQPRGGKIDGSGNGKLVVTKFGAVNGDFSTFPSSGVLTKISGAGFEGDAVINYSTPVAAYFNPFINPSTGLLDLNNYITSWGFATPGLVIIQFTWNDLGLWATDNSISSLVANFKLAADHVHTAYPSAKVIFSIEPYGSINGNLDWNGKKYSVLRFTELMLAQFEDNVSYNSWVKIAPSYAFVDLENGYSGGGTVVPCERYPSILETSGGDGVHPNTGMLQIADCIAPIVSAIIP